MIETTTLNVIGLLNYAMANRPFYSWWLSGKYEFFLTNHNRRNCNFHDNEDKIAQIAWAFFEINGRWIDSMFIFCNPSWPCARAESHQQERAFCTPVWDDYNLSYDMDYSRSRSTSLWILRVIKLMLCSNWSYCWRKLF